MIPTSQPDAWEAKIAQAAEAQRRASDPNASAWVGASAGTGKTKVLTDRVLALMLDGAPPERLLCLTFTKAAAAEMANRLAGRLAAWAAADDDALDAELRTLPVRDPDPALRRRARALFARVLDAAGGMKIQTLHAFCQAVLARFPLEAEIPPQTRVLDEDSAAELLHNARETVLATAGGSSPDAADLTRALATVSAEAAERTFAELLDALLTHRGRLLRFRDEAGGLEALIARICDRLGVAPGTTPDDVLAAACADNAFDAEGLRNVAAAFTAGTATEQTKRHPVVRAWIDGSVAARVAAFDEYKSLFIKKDDGALKAKPLTKAAAAAVPGANDAAQAEGERLQAVQARQTAAAIARRTAALLRLGTAILDRYAAAKRARALLDFDDLILATRNLLAKPDVAPWVLFKLDGGLDHLLVDEAQDTNPEQWEILDLLTREFFAGEGAAEALGRGSRTVFAVGDTKQSIYSFQRADPRAFTRMREHFAARIQAARQTWSPVDLTVSFRSTDAVLHAVDRVFAEPEARAGVLLDGADAVHHDPVRAGHAGKVELWPLAPAAEVPAPAPWEAPLAGDEPVPARHRLARAIAARIAGWTRGDAADGWLPARGRRMTPGDILILVRRRNGLVDEIVRELKLRGVPVAGVDRMILTDQLAVRDLIALGRVLLLPEDDLSLACVLKGPLIGLSEDALFDLAHDRPGRLWDTLRDRVGERGDFEHAYTRLSDLLARADASPPYEFFATLLGAEGGRAAILARLGTEANDPLDEFLNLALAFERDHVPSLQGFLHWLDAGAAREIKRDVEHDADVVRVMTVHGAKGLQAPVVILPDTVQPPRFKDKVLWDEARGLIVWSPRKAEDDTLAGELRAAGRQAQDEEYRRLLYVALTRAEDQLHLCGWETRSKMPEVGWYPLVRRALAADPAFDRYDFGAEVPGGWSGEGLRLETPQRRPPELGSDPSAVATAPAEVPPPSWVWTPPAAEPAQPRPLAPSRPPAADPAPRSPLSAPDGTAYQRGLLIHRLLQSLPDLVPAHRQAAGARLLAAQPELDDAAQAALLAEVLAILDDPRFAELFGADSRAEVPVVGLLDAEARPDPVSARIDRLVVRPDKVMVVDFKTNRPVPDSAEAVPEVYRAQLATYRRLMAAIYPDRPVETWLLWTDAPRLMQISDAAGGQRVG